MACNEDAPIVLPVSPSTNEEDSLKVIERYKKLMTASVGEDSLYERSKNTIYELSKDLTMTESERMNIVAGQITQMTTAISGSAMQTALAWAKEDATIGYETAILKERASQTAAEAELVAKKICTEEYNSGLVCAKIEAEIAGSIRNNGKVELYDKNDPCKPISLRDEGLKWAQTNQVESDTYRILADTFRKSGVVQIGIENGMTKGIDGDKDGHTYSQTQIARRQYVGFEDSKRTHAANSSSQTIGQLIAAEAPLDDKIVKNYNKAMDYLLSDSIPVTPGGDATLDGIFIVWDGTITDSVDANGNLTSQHQPGYVTTGAQIDNSKNIRNGDYIVAKINGGEMYVRHTVSVDNINNNDLIGLTFPTVEYDPAGASTEVYDIELYVQDMAGNKSPFDAYQLNVKYNPISL